MSGTLNKVMLIGHLGDDVKIKHFDNGGCIARFPLATNESYTNKTTNEKVTNTDWHNIVVRNKAAEVCEKYLSKGDKVYVEGKLRTRKWQGDDGADRYATEVNAVVSTLFNKIGITLVDFKLEFGSTVDGEIVVADEISPDGCRLRNSDNQSMDKDLFRKNKGDIIEAYSQILKSLKEI